MQEILINLIPFTPLFMLFFHIVDDYYLQGVLAKLKQKSYWTNKNNYPQEIAMNPKKLDKYSTDWFPALLMHSFSWSFMILLPMILFVGASGYADSQGMYNTLLYFVLGAFVVNTVIHFIVDHLKANTYSLTLVTDQMIHLLQIIVTFMVATILGLYTLQPEVIQFV